MSVPHAQKHARGFGFEQKLSIPSVQPSNQAISGSCHCGSGNVNEKGLVLVLVCGYLILISYQRSFAAILEKRFGLISLGKELR